jgi:casein kinase I family protein HRR25
LEQSRRDDLESVGYILLYLYFGELEWQNVNSTENNKMISNMKERIIQNVNKNIPQLFINYFEYIKEIGFEEIPDYLFLTNLFNNEIQNNKMC